jgi:hypothetical protein
MKLCKMAFTLKNSTMILLLQWYNTLAAHHLPHHMMPCNVSTQWNLTFNMLNFAIEYCLAINTMAATWDFDLHKHELVPAEWRIAGELCDVLQVFFHPLIYVCASSPDRSSKTPPFFSCKELQVSQQ